MLSREVCQQCEDYYEQGGDDWICLRAGDMADEQFWVCENSRVPEYCYRIFQHVVAAGMKDVK
jgi:hypothetical protein